MHICEIHQKTDNTASKTQNVAENCAAILISIEAQIHRIGTTLFRLCRTLYSNILHSFTPTAKTLPTPGTCGAGVLPIRGILRSTSGTTKDSRRGRANKKASRKRMKMVLCCSLCWFQWPGGRRVHEPRPLLLPAVNVGVYRLCGYFNVPGHCGRSLCLRCETLCRYR